MIEFVVDKLRVLDQDSAAYWASRIPDFSETAQNLERCEWLVLDWHFRRQIPMLLDRLAIHDIALLLFNAPAVKDLKSLNFALAALRLALPCLLGQGGQFLATPDSRAAFSCVLLYAYREFQTPEDARSLWTTCLHCIHSYVADTDDLEPIRFLLVTTLEELLERMVAN